MWMQKIPSYWLGMFIGFLVVGAVVAELELPQEN
jgi:hypothetical protein